MTITNNHNIWWRLYPLENSNAAYTGRRCLFAANAFLRGDGQKSIA